MKMSENAVRKKVRRSSQWSGRASSQLFNAESISMTMSALLAADESNHGADFRVEY